jgi:hypothetical protein
MDYETGISTGPGDLMGKLATFAATNGWTLTSYGVGNGASLSKGTIVCGYNTDTDEIFLRGGTSTAGAAWNSLANNPGYSVTIDCGAGPFVAYHLFAGEESGSEYLNAVIEFASGQYRHLCFGNLIKHGAYTGGTYIDGVNWNNSINFANQPESDNHQVICDANVQSGNGHVYADFDAKTNNWVRVMSAGGFTTTNGTGSVRSNGINQMFHNLGYARFNLRNLTAPLTYFANRASSLRSPLGRIPNMRQVGMGNLEPGAILSIGGDEWKCFPISQRTDSWGSGSSLIESSGPYGYAYKMPPP